MSSTIPILWDVSYAVNLRRGCRFNLIFSLLILLADASLLHLPIHIKLFNNSRIEISPRSKRHARLAVDRFHHAIL